MITARYVILATVFKYCVSSTPPAEQNNATPFSTGGPITTDPLEVSLEEWTSMNVKWSTTLTGVAAVALTLENGLIANVSTASLDLNPLTPNVTAGGSFTLTGLSIGYDKLNISLLDAQNNVLGSKQVPVSVTVGYHIVNQIYMGVMGVLLFVAFVNMGSVFDPSIFRAIAKNPVGPLVALTCQFVAMPLIAFGLSKLFFPNEPIYQLGLFLCGAVPGGGTSNMWTYLIGGNFDLSLIMTAVSSIVAFGAMPLWTVLLGPYISSENHIVVPITDIVLLVLGLLIPCGIGFLLQKFYPRVAQFCERLLTPFIIFIFIFTLTFGAYANRYIFELLTAKIAFAALLLPTLGYLVGFLLSFLFRCPKRDIIAISIETGLQNMALVVFMLNYTLPAPANTIAIVIPGSSAFMTPFPIVLMGIAIHAYDGNITIKNIKFFFSKISRCEWDFLSPSAMKERESAGERKEEIGCEEGKDGEISQRTKKGQQDTKKKEEEIGEFKHELQGVENRACDDT